MNFKMVVFAVCQIFAVCSMGQSWFEDRFDWYPNLEFSAVTLRGTLAEEIQPLRFGFDGYILLSPRAYQWSLLETGAGLGLVFIGDQTDNADGLQISTSSTVLSVNYLLGAVVPLSENFSIRVNASTGVNISNTTSSYEIVDRATFLEDLLGIQDEDIIEKVQVNEFTDTGPMYRIGGGLLFKNTIYLNFSYTTGGSLRFVTRDGISVEGDTIVYRPERSALRYFSIGLGLSFERLRSL